MEDPSSVHWKVVAFIRALILSAMLEIKIDLVRKFVLQVQSIRRVNSLSLLCLWKTVVLVGILILNWLPPIGGEPGVQIANLIKKHCK